MTRRYLFGPVDADYAADNLDVARSSGECLTFAATGDPDVLIADGDRWEDVLARLPPGWTPDLLVLFLAYSRIPRALWDAPLPRVALAADWHVLWHRYRSALAHCDLAFTDTRGAALLRRAGADHVATGNLFGCARPFLAAPPGGRRDIDVLYVGSLHPVQKGDRLAWLGRIVLALGDRWNVVIRAGVGRDEYLGLLRRARVVVNRSVRGECNLRVFEAAATGALLFQEAANEEVPRYLDDGVECVLYTESTLEPLLERYLADEPARACVAAAARRRVQALGFPALWREMLEEIDARWPQLGPRPAPALRRGDGLELRFWESLTASTGPVPRSAAESALIRELRSLLAERPSARLNTMLGLLIARRAQRVGALDIPCVARVERHLRRAAELAPGGAIFRLNHVEALWRLGLQAEAVRHGRRALALLERSEGLTEEELDVGHFPPAFDTFRVEWERAAWSHSGSPDGEARAKHRLVRWRLHSVIAALTGELEHYRLAAELLEDSWMSHAALGRALLRAARAPEAAVELRRAATLNPFDDSVACDLGDALRAARDREGEDRLGGELRLLRRAAPTIGWQDIGHAQEVVR